MIIILAFATILGCSSKPTGAPTEASAACPPAVTCPECPACPEVPPCPACTVCDKPDAVFYSAVANFARGDLHAFLTKLIVHRNGNWYDVDFATADGPQGVSADPRIDFQQGDALLAQVRAQPRNVGRVVVGGIVYQQRATTLTTWDYVSVEGTPGKMFVVTFFTTLQ